MSGNRYIKLEKPDHPNGLGYYNSYIYMVAGDNRI